MWYWIFRAGFAVILKLFFRFKLEGLENLPKKTNFIVAANHCSFMDPAIVGVAMIIAMITGVRGMIQFYKGRKEEKDVKYVIAIIGNSLGVLYLVGTIVMAIRILTKIL